MLAFANSSIAYWKSLFDVGIYITYIFLNTSKCYSAECGIGNTLLERMSGTTMGGIKTNFEAACDRILNAGVVL